MATALTPGASLPILTTYSLLSCFTDKIVFLLAALPIIASISNEIKISLQTRRYGSAARRRAMNGKPATVTERIEPLVERLDHGVLAGAQLRQPNNVCVL